MSQIAYANRDAAPPTIGTLGWGGDGLGERRARAASIVPLGITAGVQAIFFVTYWIPEMGAFPTHRWWLTQLSPLVSAGLTSGGEVQVPAQHGLWGPPAILLLLCSLAVFWVTRSPRHWLGPQPVAGPAVLGTLVCLGVLVALLITGELGSAALSVLLLLVWIAAALYATAHRIFGPPLLATRKTWRRGLPLLAAYALIGPAPTAVGRWLFAPDLRAVAAGLQHNTVALRLAALSTGSTALLYLCGLLVGVAIWVGSHAWPPRRTTTFAGLTLVMVGTLVVTGALAVPAAKGAEARASTLLYTSPAAAQHFSCGSLVLAPARDGVADPEVRTLIVVGFSCTRVATFAGYRQLATHAVGASLSPVTVHTPDGGTIARRLVGAQYGEVMVLAASDRLDGAANQLIGLRIVDAAQLWHFGCARGRALSVRFAAVPAGDDPQQGYLTRGESVPTVVATCPDATASFDPVRGPP